MRDLPIVVDGGPAVGTPSAEPSRGMPGFLAVGKMAQGENGLDPDMIGMIPGLAVHEELGRGANAVVYRARRYGVDYALKLLQASVFADPAAVTAFRREAALLACVNHPGVVAVHEVGQVRGRPYLVMELVRGRTLADIMLTTRLDEARTVAIIADVAEALAAAHRAGLTHRDVKPANVMILPDGSAKLIDFGLAARAARAARAAGAAGAPGAARPAGTPLAGLLPGEVATEPEKAAAGTFNYSAPEQTGMLTRAVDDRSDLYTVGVVLFHCLTGQLPFQAIDVGELLRLHAVASPPDVRTIRPELTPSIAGIVAKLLAKDPDDRYQSATGLAADLRSLAAGTLRESNLGTADVAAGTVEAPLVGRTTELAQLTGCWSRARAGRGGVAVIRGAPGVGKSRLVRELLSTVSPGRHLVLQGKSAPDDPVPMGPIRAAVDRFLNELHRLPPNERAVARKRIREAAGPGASVLASLAPALASLLDAPALPSEDRQEQFAVAVAGFLVSLANSVGGGILLLDDVQWLDAGTRRVLHHLLDDLPQSSLLVVATARDDETSLGAVASFESEVRTALTTTVTLPPLNDAAMARLIAAHLGGVTLTPELTSALVTRCGGNPFTADEYVRAVLDAGLVRPSWGAWILEEGGLDELDLPDNVVDLIVARVGGLGADSRALLTTAAASGTHVRSADLARICALDERDVAAGLRLAVDRRLMAGGAGHYTFVHDRIREALLGGLSDDDRADLHLKIATALDALDSPDAEHLYAVAHHFTLADPRRAPERAYVAALAAGRLALASHAPQRALEFLKTAQTAAEAGRLETGVGFHETYGLACIRVGRFTEARVHLYDALGQEKDRTRRASLRSLICESHHAAWEVREALTAAEEALAELGRSVPRNPLWLVTTTALKFVVALIIQCTGLGKGTVKGRSRERFGREAAVLAIATQAAVSAREMLLYSCLTLRQLYPATRLGKGPEYVHAMSHLAAGVRMLGLHRVAAHMFRRIHATAASLGDPRLVAYTDWVGGIIYATMRHTSVDSSAVMRRVLNEHGRWLDAQEHFNTAAVLCNRLTHEGHTTEALEWYERVRARHDHLEPGPTHHFALVKTAIQAITGPGEEADRQLESAESFLATRPDNREQLLSYVMTAMLSAVEQGQLGAPFERVAALFERSGLTSWNTWPAQHQIWVSHAYGRLAQVVVAPDEERAERLLAARKAVQSLRRVRTTSMIKVHYLIAKASYLQLAGRPDRALRLLDRADRQSQRVDAPVLGFEAARVRARALRALGSPRQAAIHARSAMNLAIDGSWDHRARAIQAEFGLTNTAPVIRSGGTAAHNVSGEVQRRRLDALQQVSLAAATVLEPRQLALVALQETIGILRAERAFLFLIDAASGELLPHLGRDADGNELAALTGYGASLVDRVRNTGEPLVVTGAEDGEAQASQSALVHGLRSIMVAPLRLKGRVQGVVYLDSRVAKGIFTRDDVDIMMAITSHVAISLETARAAQLEAAVLAASQQRDLAELLRSSMSEVTTTLDPDEVLDRMLDAATRAVPGESGCVLRADADGHAVVAVRGTAGAIGTRFETYPGDPVAVLAAEGTPFIGVTRPGQPAPPAELMPGVRSWLCVPLSARGVPVGLLLIGATTLDTYTDAHLQIAAAVAGQGMAAYDNACLFEQVNTMATVDAMTGVANRGHFLDLAVKAFAEATPGRRSVARPLTAIMLDIDHFKKVNDTYGHLVGDTVIQEVGARLRSAVREGDLVGRYGGEEFAIVVVAEPERADDLADRLLDVVAATPIETTAGPLRVTVSVGKAHRRDIDADLGALLGRADQALYRAKEEGRNRIASD